MNKGQTDVCLARVASPQQLMPSVMWDLLCATRSHPFAGLSIDDSNCKAKIFNEFDLRKLAN
jgi:hypothetical protein